MCILTIVSMVSRALMVVYTILIKEVVDTVAPNEDEGAHSLIGIAQHIQHDITRGNIPPNNNPRQVRHIVLLLQHIVYTIYSLFFIKYCFITVVSSILIFTQIIACA